MARVTQAHIDARRDDIFDAAKLLFLNRGFSSVTMQDIANEAGISAGAIYRYYASKDDLARTFFEHCAGSGPAELVRNTAPDAPAVERLTRILDAVSAMWVETHGQHVIGEIQTSMAAIRQPDDIGPIVHDAREQLYDALIEIIEDGQRQGEIDPALDPRSLAITLNACVVGIGLIAIGAGEEGLQQQTEMMFRVLTDLLNRLGPATVGTD